MNSRVLFASLITLFFVSQAKTQTVKTYEGYEVKIYENYTHENSKVVVRKGKKILASHAEGRSGSNFSEFQFLPLLGRSDKQLVITQFTGGAHCCRAYWIYDLKPSFRLLFRSNDYALGDGGDDGEGKFQNLDGDRELEIVDKNDSFLYFDELAYVSSPRPLLIFDYDRKTRRFELANRRFARFILKDADVWRKRARDEKEINPAQFGTDVFGIFLDYLYAGREQEGWKFYYGKKDVLTNGWFHNQAKVRKILNSDRAYKLIYKK